MTVAKVVGDAESCREYQCFIFFIPHIVSALSSSLF